MKKTIILTLSILTLITLLSIALKAPKGNYSLSRFLEKPLPPFSVKIIGTDHLLTEKSIQENNKKYKLINFFASWCGTCKLEHPDLLKLANNPNLELIGIAWKDKEKKTLKWLKKNGDPYDILASDRKGDLKYSFGIIGVPESFLVNSENIVIARFRGPIDLQKIEYLISR